MATRDDKPPMAGTADGPVTYLLLDGENLDATLGVNVLGHRPAPEDRPRWERVLDFVREVWGRPVTALFFINASSGELPMPFLQALVSMGLRPVLLSGPPGVKVVDVGIQKTLDAIGERDGDVMLGSHDADFLPQVTALLDGDRRVGLLAFREFVNGRYTELVASGLQIFDLEDDARSFNRVLPRLRVIDIDAFDPEAFL
jgi:putative heme uptake system protein